MFVATRAIVATSSYGPGPRGFRADADLPGGAEAVSGVNAGMRAVRDQAGHGADWIKIYADYRVGVDRSIRPTFTQPELDAMVEAAHLSGRPVAAHAMSDAGIRMAVQAGVDTIEHGYFASADTFARMHARGVAWLPTLTAVEAFAQYYDHYVRGTTPPTQDMRDVRQAFERARKAGVTIACGSDVGVFRHGDNWREPALMVEAGMTAREALQACTSTAARVLRQQDRIGRIAPGLRADFAAFEGDPAEDIEDLRRPAFVMKDGVVYRGPGAKPAP